MSGKDEKGRFIKGNQFWRERHKHGRDKDYLPDELLNEFFDYLEWVEENSFEEKEDGSIRDSDTSKAVEQNDGTFKARATKVKSTSKIKKIKRSVTTLEFCMFLGKNGKYVEHYDKNKSTDCATVKSYILNSIKSQQLAGSLSGIYNANIVSQLLGLTTKTATEHKGINITVNPVTVDIPSDNLD